MEPGQVKQGAKGPRLNRCLVKPASSAMLAAMMGRGKHFMTLVAMWLLVSRAVAAEPAAMRFDQAHLLKPRENPDHAFAHSLSPLVLEEVRGTNAPAVFTNVFFQVGAVQLGGRTHAQITYWWHYDHPKAQPRPPEHRPQARRGPDASPLKRTRAETGAPNRLTAQGVRLTLDSRGFPVIYEVLGHTGRVAQIFVNQSLESAARAEFGSALPGRQFAIERRVSDAPDIVVPRVIEDPPAVMGPIIYLHEANQAVATVICRCMPAEAKTLIGQSFYELVPADFSGNVPAATRLDAAQPRGLREDFLTQTNRLSQSLRLPRDF